MTTVVPASPPAKQLEPHEMEGVCLNDLHKDRDRVKYIKMVAERKMKVRLQAGTDPELSQGGSFHQLFHEHAHF